MEIYQSMAINEDSIKKARKRVKSKKGFYKHLSSFLIVNIFLFLINLFTTPGDWWFIFPLLSWGIGLASHYVSVFGLPIFGTLSDRWEDEQMEIELMKEEEKEARNRRILLKKENVEPLELPDELELKDFKKLRKDWNDKDFV